MNSKSLNELALRDKLSIWFRSPLGKVVFSLEKEQLENILPDLFGYHILQFGYAAELDFLNSSRISNKTVLFLEYSEIDGILGINAFIKIYFSNDVPFNSSSLPEIDGVQLNYNSVQKKLSLEKLNSIVLKENTTTVLIDNSMLTDDLPSINKIELQLLKNGVFKVYTTDETDALTYGWEKSFDILS